MQLAMGMVVNFFFSGFVLGKVPFALSPRFKLMLQVIFLLSSWYAGSGRTAWRAMTGFKTFFGG